MQYTQAQTLLDHFRTLEDTRPESPDGSEPSILFSAYDAMLAAVGRMEEAANCLAALPQSPLTNSKPHSINRRAIQETCDNMLVETQRLLEILDQAKDHILSAQCRLFDADDILSERTHPAENPAPYNEPPKPPES